MDSEQKDLSVDSIVGKIKEGIQYWNVQANNAEKLDKRMWAQSQSNVLQHLLIWICDQKLKEKVEI